MNLWYQCRIPGVEYTGVGVGGVGVGAPGIKNILRYQSLRQVKLGPNDKQTNKQTNKKKKN